MNARQTLQDSADNLDREVERLNRQAQEARAEEAKIREGIAETPEQEAERLQVKRMEELRAHPEVQAVLGRWLGVLDVHKEGRVRKDMYVTMSKTVFKSLHSDEDADEQDYDDDWEQDSHGKGYMENSAIADALFQLACAWNEDFDAMKVAGFLRRMVETIDGDKKPAWQLRKKKDPVLSTLGIDRNGLQHWVRDIIRVIEPPHYSSSRMVPKGRRLYSRNLLVDRTADPRESPGPASPTPEPRPFFDPDPSTMYAKRAASVSPHLYRPAEESPRRRPILESNRRMEEAVDLQPLLGEHKSPHVGPGAISPAPSPRLEHAKRHRRTGSELPASRSPYGGSPKAYRRHLQSPTPLITPNQSNSQVPNDVPRVQPSQDDLFKQDASPRAMLGSHRLSPISDKARIFSGRSPYLAPHNVAGKHYTMAEDPRRAMDAAKVLSQLPSATIQLTRAVSPSTLGVMARVGDESYDAPSSPRQGMPGSKPMLSGEDILNGAFLQSPGRGSPAPESLSAVS